MHQITLLTTLTLITLSKPLVAVQSDIVERDFVHHHDDDMERATIKNVMHLRRMNTSKSGKSIKATKTTTISTFTKGLKTTKSNKSKGSSSSSSSKKTKKMTKTPKSTKKSKKNKSQKKIPKGCQFNTNTTIDSYQDGSCDALLNTKQCDYDGGDCDQFNIDYPDCIVQKPNWVGDNYCDGIEYNTTACGYDGGDCLLVVDFGCSGAGNGYCENIFNTEACDFDGGDCDEFNEKYPDCKVPDPSFVGDGLCDIEPYFSKECGYDGGDCDSFPVNCTITDTYAIGNGHCNIEFNTSACEYDGGDCL